MSLRSRIYHGLKIVGQFKKVVSYFKYISMVRVHKLTVEGGSLLPSLSCQPSPLAETEAGEERLAMRLGG